MISLVIIECVEFYGIFKKKFGKQPVHTKYRAIGGRVECTRIDVDICIVAAAARLLGDSVWPRGRFKRFGL